jgi:HEAT repeat protein
MSTGEQGSSAPQPIAPAKFWLKSALVVVAVCILLALAWTPSRHEEPVYQGKTMREWLWAYGDSHLGTEAHTQSESALRKIGTNGIPTLLRMIQTPDSNFRTKLKALMEKQTFIESSFQDAWDIRNMASWGFSVLAEDAKGAVPELLSLAKRGSGTDGRSKVITALGLIGPSAQAAVPTLLAIAADVKDQDRGDAIESLGVIRSSAESVVPFLESCLRDPAEHIRMNAVDALCEFGEAAKSSVPSLIPLLADPSESVRRRSTHALKLIDREAATKAGIP